MDSLFSNTLLESTLPKQGEIVYVTLVLCYKGNFELKFKERQLSIALMLNSTEDVLPSVADLVNHFITEVFPKTFGYFICQKVQLRKMKIKFRSSLFLIDPMQQVFGNGSFDLVSNNDLYCPIEFRTERKDGKKTDRSIPQTLIIPFTSERLLNGSSESYRESMEAFTKIKELYEKEVTASGYTYKALKNVRIYTNNRVESTDTRFLSISLGTFRGDLARKKKKRKKPAEISGKIKSISELIKADGKLMTTDFKRKLKSFEAEVSKPLSNPKK